MTLHTSSRIGLLAVVTMADQEGARVSSTAIAQTFGVSEDHAAKVLQQLVRAGICEGQRGAHGGYRLVRSPGRLTMLDVVEALEGPTRRPREKRATAHPASAAIAAVLDEVDQYARATLHSVTIATLAAKPLRHAAG